MLTVFDLFQNQEINRRLIFVLLESKFLNIFLSKQYNNRERERERKRDKERGRKREGRRGKER